MTSERVTIFIMLLHMVIKCRGVNKFPHVGVYKANNNFTHYAFVDGARYRLSKEPKSFDDAVKYCKENNSTLVTITSREENSNIQYFAQYISSQIPKTYEIWIGLRLNEYKKENISGIWSDQTEWHKLKDYSSFHVKEPKEEYGRYPRCVQLLYRDKLSLSNWNWDNAWCTGVKPFICENQGPDSDKVNELAESIIAGYNKNVGTNATQIHQTARTMENILEASIESIVKSDQQILNETIFVVERSLGNYNYTNKDLNEDLPRIKIEAAKITKKSDGPNTRQIGDADKKTRYIRSYAEVDTNLHEELFSDETKDSLLLTSIVYRRPEIFEGAEDISHTSPSRVLTDVLSVDVPGVDVSNLSSPIKIVNSIPRYNTNRSLSTINTRFSEVPANVLQNPGGVYWNEEHKFTVEEKCVFWDFSKSSWSTEGCEMIQQPEAQPQAQPQAEGTTKTIICSCHHMTHFAVILSLNSEYLPAYLDIVTQIGCWISIFCVVLTFTINISIVELRTKLSHQILNNICIALFAINLIFVTGIDRDGNKIKECKIVTVSLHYSVLLLWCWLFVKGIFLFRHLIYAQHRIRQLNAKRFLIIASTVSYIVPAIIVFPTAFSLKDYYNKKYCWISRDPMLYTIIIPIGFVLLTNIIIFAIAMYNITCGRKTFKQESSLKDFTIAMRRAMCMIFATGIPWVFGYLMLLAQDPTSKQLFSFLFAIINSLQGAIIFILYCASNKNVQDLVCKKFKNRPRFGLSLRRRLHFSVKKRQQQLPTSSRDDTNVTEMNSVSVPATSRPYRTRNY